MPSANALVSHAINSAFIPSRCIVDYREKYIHTIKAADKLKFVECRNRLERVIKSRKNTPEEKSKSDSIEEKSKEWLTPEKLQQKANGEATGALHSKVYYSKVYSKPKKLVKQYEVKFASRGAMMLSIARGFEVNSGFAKPLPRPSIHVIIDVNKPRKFGL